MRCVLTFAVLGSLALAFCVFNLWWNTLRVYPPSKQLEKPGASFPEGFLWGSGEDAYQHEGNSTNNDWHAWENEVPSPIDAGDKLGSGTDFWNRYKGDFQLAADDFHTTHRIGVEWSRIEPERGVYDEDAIAVYVDMLKTMKEEHGFVTFLNLWHFTLPMWAVDAGGWENEEMMMERWEAFVTLCAQRFAPYVDYWSTMIDSQIYPLTGYMIGEIPPCQKDQKRALEVYRILVKAHGVAYHLIKEHGVRKGDAEFVPQVGQIYFFFDFHRRGFIVDAVVRKLFRDIFNWGFLDGITKGKLNLFVPFDRMKADIPEAKDTLDWLGVNYFTRAVVSFDPFEPGLVSRRRQTQYTTSDMDWEIFPEGIYLTLKRIKKRYGDIPLFITECGLADVDDSRRPRFVVDHLAWVKKAIDDGVDVRGFFHWSLTDNWEWQRGHWPRFGMYRVDYETKERTRTETAALFAKIAKDNALPEQLPDKLPIWQLESRLPRDDEWGSPVRELPEEPV